MATVEVRAGDTNTAITASLTKRDGTVAVITGATVNLVVTDFSGGAVFNKPAAIVSGPAGTVSYTLVAADTARKGLFSAQWVVTYSGGAVESYPTAPQDLCLAVY